MRHALIAVPVLLALAFFDSATPSAQPASAGQDTAARHLTVRFKPGVPPSAVAGLNAVSGGLQAEWQPRSHVQHVEVRSGVDAEKALAKYQASPLVAEASVTRFATILDTPNDPKFPYQWHLRSTDAGVWADAAWDIAPNRGNGVVVAVIDTGVAYEDYNGALGGRPQTFKRAADLASTPFVAPWDFANNDSHPNDDHGHGSHVTGTISQDTNNALGMAGVAPNSTIMPLKAMDYAGNGADGDVVEAIYHAVDNGAGVINMSLGWPGSGVPDAQGNYCGEITGLTAALDYADAHGVVVIAASGNDGGTVLCPAAYPTVIAVGATRFDAQVTSYSNRGSTLDITAPGGDPYVDQNGDGYTDGVLQQSFCYDPTLMLLLNLYGTFCDVYNEGTSMATPHVAGIAALLLGEDGALTPNEVKAHILWTARDGGSPGWDSNYGWGIADAAAALAALKGVPKPPPPVIPGLAAPTNLSATAVSSSRINLAWTDNATAETGYKVERSADGGATFSLLTTTAANATGYANANLAAATAYTYRVRAYKGPDFSAYSNGAAATTQPPPAPPTSLTATAVSSSRINLAWTDNATNEAGYRIERSTDGITFTAMATLPANATSYPNTSLPPGTTYHYRVRAYDGPNNSAPSNVASATTQAAPAAPTNLAATATSSSRVTLSWTDNATNEAGFKIERSTDGVTFTQVATAAPNATTYSVINLAAGTTYRFRIRAYEGTNHSAYSNTASATTQPTPAAPTNLAATATSSSRINLAWTDNATNEAGFKIERSTTAGGPFAEIATVSANLTTYAAMNLAAGTPYTFRVRAYDGPNHSAYTNTATATTQPTPAAPSNLTATGVSSARINLAWADNATNETGYKIERSTDGVTFTQVALLPANVTSYPNNVGLTPGTTYHYRVRAYDGPNHSAHSNIATATTFP
jgi:subtilisin family serine protease